MQKIFKYIFLGGLLPLACAGGDGTLSLTIYGEAFIEQGIQADQMDDGWAVEFDRFVVTVDAIDIADMATGALAPVDLTTPTNGEGQQLAELSVGDGEYTNAAFSITRIEVAGSATKAGTTKTFDWTFETPTRYVNCATTTIVDGDSPGRFEITVHADHLFYDSIVAEEPQLLFQALADADTDADGSITREELASQGIGAYDPGNAAIDNLADWLDALTQTVGHVDGEGHCDVEGQG